MQALRFERFGDLGELKLEVLERPAAAVGEVLVVVRAASLNPSDVKNVNGKMEGTILPRTPGRDFAGVVVAGPPGRVGHEVWGACGEIGFTRDGSHAEFIVVPEDGVARKPASLTFEEAAAGGVNFVTAWAGLVDAAALGAGETVLVTGSGGGVGSSVIQLARWMGARSIGIDRTDSGELPPYLRPDVAVTNPADLAGVVAQQTQGRGVDVVFDTVGAPLFENNLAALARGGRYAIISSAGERRTSFDILDFYHKRLVLHGVDTRAISSVAAAHILERLRAGFESSALRAPAIAERFSLENGLQAYRAVEAGVRGKVVLVMSAASGA